MSQDLLMTEIFLETLDPNETRWTFQTFPDKPELKGTILGNALTKVLIGSLSLYRNQLIELNNRGAGIFVTINKADGMGRKVNNITHIRSFFADKDDGKFADFATTPTIVVDSGRGQHAYWVATEPLNPLLVNFRELQRGLAKCHNSDLSVSDLPRVMRLPGFLHQKGDPKLVRLVYANDNRYSLDTIVNLFGQARETVQLPTPTPTPTANINKKGVLRPAVSSFFLEPWSSGVNTHTQTVHAIYNCKKNNFTREECINLFLQKGEELREDLISQINAVYESENAIVDPYVPDTKINIRELLWREDTGIYQDVSNASDVWVVNEEIRIKMKMTLHTVKTVLSREFRNRVNYCKVVYNPTLDKIITHNKMGIAELNVYNKPPFFMNLPHPQSELPDAYKYFFNHLFTEGTESYEYVLDWLAYSLRGKNIPVLALVGTARGIGKNVLGNILSRLHGLENFSICSQSIIAKEFNSQMYGKTLIHFDEVSITNHKEFESIKAYTNPYINVEGKGVDAENRPFYGNIYLTNNQMESLSGVNSDDDRQFSIPEMTDKKLDLKELSKFKPSNYIGASINWIYEDEDLLAGLAAYLLQRSLANYDYVTNFKSKHYYKVVRSSQPEWQRFLLEDFRMKHINCAVKMSDIKATLNKLEGVRPGRAKMEAFCAQNADLCCLRKKDGVYYIWFGKEGESAVTLEKRASTDKDSFEILNLPKCLI